MDHSKIIYMFKTYHYAISLPGGAVWGNAGVVVVLCGLVVAVAA